ncbi:MAG: aldehyde dehydrogenase family protein [Bacteroidota bacterium]
MRVPKTYKLYINGAFVRSEQGRVLRQTDKKDRFVANYARASRKDFRDAVTAARKAFAGWSKRTAFNRSQIVYRIAEMLDARRAEFVDLLRTHAGFSERKAQAEVDRALEATMYYAGWADKYQQVLGSVNPVAAPYFNFSVPEPTGVVVVMASPTSPLLGLLGAFLPALAAGNTVIAIFENEAPTVGLSLAEVIATSDVPAGVVNLLAGQREELVPHAASHMDVNAIVSIGAGASEREATASAAADNVKRVLFLDDTWAGDAHLSLYRISPVVEVKTAWHPVGV